jgi:hypothetical protein
MSQSHKRLRKAEAWLVKQLRANIRRIKRAQGKRTANHPCFIEGAARCSCIFMAGGGDE